jgi:hypothetical protein
MPDITLCTNTACVNRGQCYRFMALPTAEYQSFAVFTPNTNEVVEPGRDVDCDWYWPLPSNPEKIKTTPEDGRTQ